MDMAVNDDARSTRFGAQPADKEAAIDPSIIDGYRLIAAEKPDAMTELLAVHSILRERCEPEHWAVFDVRSSLWVVASVTTSNERIEDMAEGAASEIPIEVVGGDMLAVGRRRVWSSIGVAIALAALIFTLTACGGSDSDVLDEPSPAGDELINTLADQKEALGVLRELAKQGYVTGSTITDTVTITSLGYVRGARAVEVPASIENWVTIAAVSSDSEANELVLDKNSAAREYNLARNSTAHGRWTITIGDQIESPDAVRAAAIAIIDQIEEQ